MSFCVAGARDSAPCQKRAKREGFVAFPKILASVGHLNRIWKDVFRVAGAIQETCSSEMLGGQGADFLRRVAVWSIRSSGLQMILRDRRSTSHDLASLFRGGRNTSDRWSGKSLNVLVRGCQLCTQLSIFDGSLRELLRFCFCQLWKLRTSRRIPSFLTLSMSKLRKSRRIAPFLMLPNF